jgi:hypothetical protein
VGWLDFGYAAGMPGSPSPSSADAQAAAVSAATRAAAALLSVSVAEVDVQLVEARQWPDASLGCPRPGLMYAQVITPGFVVVVRGADKHLEYHTDTRGRVVLCQAT